MLTNHESPITNHVFNLVQQLCYFLESYLDIIEYFQLTVTNIYNQNQPTDKEEGA